MMLRHFLDLADLPAEQIRAILAEAQRRKATRSETMVAGEIDVDAPARGRIAALLFMHVSTRTRISFDVALRQLGASAIVMKPGELHLSRNESMADTARVFSGYVDALVARVDEHSVLVELARHATIPVINGLSQHSHPCQIIGDMMTIAEHCGPLEDQTLVWLGDGNNVATSFIQAAAIFGFRLHLACPADCLPDEAEVRKAIAWGGHIEIFEDPLAAARDADCVITDTWASLHHQGADREATIKSLYPYQVNDQVMAAAAAEAIFLHCLPAYRECEVTSAVIDGSQSRIFPQAVNRLHAQKAILLWCWGLI